MAELIQNQVGLTRGSAGALNAITNWLGSLRRSSTVAHTFGKTRGKPDNHDTLTYMMIDVIARIT